MAWDGAVSRVVEEGSTVEVMSSDVAIDAPLVSYEEFVAWPETTAPVEVVDGRVIVNASPVGPHHYAVNWLTSTLGEACSDDCVAIGSSWDWVLVRAPLRVRQPDVVVVRREQLRHARLESPPLLAVEVLSPESRERDLVTKRREYAEAGLAWYWLVSLDVPQILVLRNDSGTFVEHASVRRDERLVIAQPFEIDVAPTDLVV
jgi:Uma2 family endonuclease